MNETLRIRLTHAFLSVLLAAGLCFPVLGILDSSFLSVTVLFPLLTTVLFFELAAVKRATAFAAAAVAAAASLFWIFASDGLTIVSDIARAVSLRITGIGTALPLVASHAVILITVLLTLISCIACLRSVSCFPAVILCVGLILLIYLTASFSLIPWALPAIAALLLLQIFDRFPETSLLHTAPWILLLVLAAFLITSGGIREIPCRKKPTSCDRLSWIGSSLRSPGMFSPLHPRGTILKAWISWAVSRSLMTILSCRFPHPVRSTCAVWF